jgi:hypothetical protein
MFDMGIIPKQGVKNQINVGKQTLLERFGKRISKKLVLDTIKNR